MTLSRSEIIHLYEIMMRNPEATAARLEVDGAEVLINLNYALMKVQPIPFENIFKP